VIANPLLFRLRDALEQAQVPYMLTGSFASTTYGKPRGTQDVDIVIAPTRGALVALLRAFPATEFYADEEDALRALEQVDQFNVLEHATGWKVDFYIAKGDAFSQTALQRRRVLEVAGVEMYVSSPEDVIIAKLQWAKLGGSARQIEDAAGIVHFQSGKLDIAYLERWVRVLDLAELWQEVQTNAGPQ